MNLRAKLVSGMVAAVISMGLISLVIMQLIVYPRLFLKLQKRGVALAKNIAGNNIHLILTENFFDLQLLLHDIKTGDEGIEYIFIVDARGMPLAHTFEKTVPEDLRKIGKEGPAARHDIRRLVTEKGGITDIAVPLFEGRGGYLHLGLSEESVRRDIREINTTFLWVILVSISLSGGLALFFGRKVTKPLLELSAVAKEVGAGNLERRFDVTSGDEIGALGSTLNRMVEMRRKAEEDQKGLIIKLQEALENVRTLQGILPICSSCKKIRDDKGYWNNVEEYVRDHSDAEFSHGICPDCAKSLYPEYYKGENHE
ncbi:MAG: HAMP domain-containing protein [Nitrospirae bacterium]|nr:HAMP domain-containing protein [Nitrospirota bacterium]